MDDAPAAARMDRRTVLLGAMSVAGAPAAAVLLSGDDALAASGEPARFAGTVVARPSPQVIHVEVPGARRIVVTAPPQSEIVDGNGQPRGLDHFAVGDAVAIEVDPGQPAAPEADAVVSALITPAVLGVASDLDVSRG